MLAVLFYVILAWVLISLGTGVYANLVGKVPTDRAIHVAADTLMLPVRVVKRLFDK